jgi:hypothetical protein
VHMLSVGHIRPGGEIAVSSTWTAPLSFLDGTPRLRVPTTVGEIFGRSPLIESDDLVAGGHVHGATVTVACQDGRATLLGAGASPDGTWTVSLNAPIEIVVSGWAPRSLEGVAADGRRVTLAVEPVPGSDNKLDVDLLCDRSGSMEERAQGDDESWGSKFAVAKAGLVAVARTHLRADDHVHAWEFSSDCRDLGDAKGPAAIERLFTGLRGPSGGTELGLAFDRLLAGKGAGNVIVITDGKTWAFDPQRYANAGMRLTAILIGEDALEGGVAHLAGMTGGQVFVAAGAEADLAIAAAFAAAREPVAPRQQIMGRPTEVIALRRGARLVATWSNAVSTEASTDERYVAATAAMLAIPLMPAEHAAALAAAEGIVCHLTSLVLVDDAGERQEGLPATRKVALSLPRTAAPLAAGAVAASAVAAAPVSSRAMAPVAAAPAQFSDARFTRSQSMGGMQGRAASTLPPEGSVPPQEEILERAMRRITGKAAALPPDVTAVGLERLAGRIDWDADPERLRVGDLSLLAPDVADMIRRAARLPRIVEAATAAGIDPVVFVVAILARVDGRTNRSAGRIARAALHGVAERAVASAAAFVGL